MITEELTNQLFDALVKRKERFESDFGDIRIRTYSGRGMYGSYCLGLVCEGCYHNAMLFWLADTIKEEQKALQNEIEKFVKVGDVFVSSWGYEQTNIDYYQVVGIKGKSTLTLREISAEVVETTHYDAGRKVPSKDNFIGEAFDKRANIYKIGNNVNVRVSLNSFSSASLKQPEVDGSYKSDYFSSYY